MHMAHGRETPFSVALRSRLPYATISKAVDTLVKAGLIPRDGTGAVPACTPGPERLP